MQRRRILVMAQDRHQGDLIFARCGDICAPSNAGFQIMELVAGNSHGAKELVSAVAQADVVLIGIASATGLTSAHRRGLDLAQVFGCRCVVVVTGSTDHGDDGQRQQEITEAVETARVAWGMTEPIRVIALSELAGEQGLNGLLDMPVSQPNRRLRLPVQAILGYASDGYERRLVAGLIDAGQVRVGDRVVCSPSNRSALVRAIRPPSGRSIDCAEVGCSVGLELEEDLPIGRGEVISHLGHVPMVGTRLRVTVVWLGANQEDPAREYELRLATASVPVRILRILRTRSLGGGPHDGSDRVSDLVIEASRPIAFDVQRDRGIVARFQLLAGHAAVGVGSVTGSVADAQEDLRSEARLRDFHWVPGAVSERQRAARFGHHAAVVMFVGRAGSGQVAFARAVEAHLFAAGRNAAMLDGTNILLGLDQDLAADATRGELVRRFGEVVNILLRTGLLVISSTHAITAADRPAVQALIGEAPIILIEVDPDGGSESGCDLRISGREAEPEIAVRVADLLLQRGIC